MRYTIFFASAAFAVTTPLSSLLRYTTKAVLPLDVPTDIIGGNGFNNLAGVLLDGSQNLGSQVNILNTVAAGFNAGANETAYLNALTAVWSANKQLSMTAISVENRVCGIAANIASQQVQQQLQNVVTSVKSMEAAVIKYAMALRTIISMIKANDAIFSDDEKAAIVTAIGAVAGLAQSSVSGLTRLASAMQDAGNAGLGASVAALQAAITATGTITSTAQSIAGTS